MASSTPTLSQQKRLLVSVSWRAPWMQLSRCFTVAAEESESLLKYQLSARLVEPLR